MALRLTPNAPVPLVVGAGLEVAGEFVGVVMVKGSESWEGLLMTLGTGVLMAGTPPLGFVRRSRHAPPPPARR